VDTPNGAKMRKECPMAKRKATRARRAFTPEFKAEAVRLCKAGDRTIRQVAVDLDLTETALREWVKRAATEAEAASSETLSTGERDELKELRKRVKRLEMEREILKNRRGRRPTCWARSSGRATTRAARKERPAAFWRFIPVKKHGPGNAADLRLVTPSGDPV
jgi:transposase